MFMRPIALAGALALALAGLAETGSLAQASAQAAEYGVPVERVINGGGVPQNNPVLNQVYADVLNKPVLVPDGTPTSLGSCIFALLAAGAISSVEQGQSMLCLPHRIFLPQPEAAAIYERLYAQYRAVYFALGTPDAAPAALGAVLPELKRIAVESAFTS